MHRDKRLRRVFALKAISKSKITKTSATVHPQVGPPDLHEFPRRLREIRQKEEAEERAGDFEGIEESYDLARSTRPWPEGHSILAPPRGRFDKSMPRQPGEGSSDTDPVGREGLSARRPITWTPKEEYEEVERQKEESMDEALGMQPDKYDLLERGLETERDEHTPYQEYLENELGEFRSALEEKEVAERVSLWKTLDLVKLPTQEELEDYDSEQGQEEEGELKRVDPGERPIYFPMFEGADEPVLDDKGNVQRLPRSSRGRGVKEEGSEYDYLVVDPYDSSVDQLYLGASQLGDWYPTRVSALLFWLSINGGKGFERDFSRPIQVPGNHPFKDFAPPKIYALTPEQETLVLHNSDLIYKQLDQILPSLHGALNIPRLNRTRARLSPDGLSMEMDDTRGQNASFSMKRPGSEVPEGRRRGDPMASPQLEQDEKALAKHLGRDLANYPKLQKAFKILDEDDSGMIASIIKEFVTQRFRSEEGKFEPALFGKLKEIQKDPYKQERILSVLTKVIVQKFKEHKKRTGH